MNTLTLKSVLVFLCLACSIKSIANKSKERVPGKPLVFIENMGQLIDDKGAIRNDIDFKVPVGTMNIGIGAGLIQYQWNKTVESKNGLSLEIYGMNVRLIGANTGAIAIKEKAHSYHENYYLPQCPDGVTAYSYEKITYKNIYPNIDWVLYVGSNTLKYDFVVHEGGNANAIRLRYEGDTAMAILPDGSFAAYTPAGIIREEAPYVYELRTVKGKQFKEKVSSRYSIDSDELGFEIGKYGKGTLVIDPTLRWTAYEGGSNPDNAYAVTCKYGNPTDFRVYIAGSTLSYNIMVPKAGHQAVHADMANNNGLEDGFVIAVNNSGTPDWYTYYGGSDKDEFRGISRDKDGNLYLAGGTRSSSGIASSGGWQKTIGGGNPAPASVYLDGMVVKLNDQGQRIWGTYVGGNGYDQLYALALDASGNVYVTGESYSTNLNTNITTPGSFRQTNPTGSRDVVLVKFNAAGQRLWGTYYGDDKDDYGTALVCDKQGNVYLAGCTRDDTCGHSVFPAKDTAIATPGAFRTRPANVVHQLCPPPNPPPAPPPSVEEAFLAKFDATGKRLWGTYYGGTGYDYATALAYDSSASVLADGSYTQGMIYLGGRTSSSNDIATPDGYQTNIFPASMGLPQDGFVAAFTPLGKRYWSTYVGTTGMDAVNGLDVNNKGLLTVVGSSTADGLARFDAHRISVVGSDAFLVIFQEAAKLYGTYIGGNSADMAYGVINSDVGHTYITGVTTSSDMGYHNSNPNFSGANRIGTLDNDAFLTRLDPELERWTYLPEAPYLQCPGTEYLAALKFGDPGAPSLFLTGNTFTIQMSDASGSFVNAQTIASGNNTPKWTIPANTPPGNYRIRAISTRPLITSDALPIQVKPVPYPQITSGTIGCEGDTLKLTATDTVATDVTYSWIKVGSTFMSYAKDTFITPTDTSHAGTYVIIATLNGECTASDTVNIVVNPTPAKPEASYNGPICAGEQLLLSVKADTSDAGTIEWSGPSLSSTSINVLIDNADISKTGNYVAKLIRRGCVNADTLAVIVRPSPDISQLLSNSPVCTGDSLWLSAQVAPAGATFKWSGPLAFTSGKANEVLPNAHPGMNGYYRIDAVLGVCKASDSILVTVVQSVPTPVIMTNSPVTLGDTLELNADELPGAMYVWTGPNGFTDTTRTPRLLKVTKAMAGTYSVKVYMGKCWSAASVVVAIADKKGTKEELPDVFPNPNSGSFTIRTEIDYDQAMPLLVFNSDGKLVYEQKLIGTNGLLEEKITLPGGLAAGMYKLRMTVNGKLISLPVLIKK